MDILNDIGVSKLSAKVFSKVNYSFKCNELIKIDSKHIYNVTKFLFQTYAVLLNLSILKEK